jgi:1-phosphofructokinase
MSVEGFVLGSVNRSLPPAGKFSPAGKGVNVSVSLKSKDVESIAIALCGNGFIGDEFVRLLNESGVKSTIIPVKGCDTRINAKLESGDAVTEINGCFSADEAAVDKVRETLKQLESGDYLVIGGSLPRGFEPDFYAQIAQELSQKGVSVIVDTSGEPLRKVIEGSNTFLIKPNQHELGELYDTKILTFDDAVEYGKKLGCNALISMGDLGAVLIADEKVYFGRTPKVVKGYTVGAGDALVAGFLASFIRTSNYEKSVNAGVNSAVHYIESHEN